MKSKGDGVDDDAVGGDGSASLSLPIRNQDESPSKDAHRSLSTITRSKIPQKKDKQLISGNRNSNSS